MNKETPTLSKRLRRVVALSITGLLIGLLTGCNDTSLRLAPRPRAVSEIEQPLVSLAQPFASRSGHAHAHILTAQQPCSDQAPCASIHTSHLRSTRHL